jgi:hypothetical protein
MLYGARICDVNMYKLSFMKYCLFINIYKHDECACMEPVVVCVADLMHL